MITVFYDLSTDDADAVGLVLASEGIDFQFKWNPKELIDISIKEWDKDKALIALSLYMEENVQKERPKLFIKKINRSTSGLFVSFLLFFIHVKIEPPMYHQAIIDRYGASAELILKGEIYRCTTALFLHGDYMHLIGNMAGIAFFCSAVISILGTGLGWLMIVCSGITGNWINAFFYQKNHYSIGASTAVFGSIGILAAYQCIRLFKEKGSHFHMQAILPMGAGLSLLGLLGTSEHSDVSAHLFGFISGSMLGFVYSLSEKHQYPDWFQSLCLFVAVIILIMSWYYPEFKTLYRLMPCIPQFF